MTLIASLLTALTLAAQTPPLQTTPPPRATPAPNQYVLGPQDLLRIVVADEPDLTASYRVDSDGFITFPLVKSIAAAGLTVIEFQDRLRAKLADGFIRNPIVRVEVEAYKSQSVIVSGEVRSPNEIPMSGTMTLLKALALAGSPTTAASSELTIAHRPDPATTGTTKDPAPLRVNWKDIMMGKAPDVPLRDGDLINVPKAQQFYMNGQVRNSGAYVWEPGLTVEQAIALAGGLTERGSDRRISATRIVNGKSKDVKLSLSDKVQPNDVITINSRIF
jgi:polysaccharide export outer membrane protein